MKNNKKQSRLATFDEFDSFADTYNLRRGYQPFPLSMGMLERNKPKKKPIVKKSRKVTIEKLQALIDQDKPWSYPALTTIIRVSGMSKDIGLSEFRKRGFIEVDSRLSTPGSVLYKILCDRRVNGKTQAHVTKLGFEFVLYTLKCIDSNIYDESSTIESI